MAADPPDVLLKRILLAENDTEGIDVENLLNAIYDGYDVENVRFLLHSEHLSAVECGAWILYELPPNYAGKLIDECDRLLAYDYHSIRFYALGIVLDCALAEDSDLIAKALWLICDPAGSVKWRCLGFMTGLRLEQLNAALSSQNLGELRPHVEWLISQDMCVAEQEVRRKIESDQWLDRAYGAVAATKAGTRLAYLLQVLTNDADSALARFAEDELEMQQLPGSI